MKKPIFKFAFANKKTSLRFGTSAKMALMVKLRKAKRVSDHPSQVSSNYTLDEPIGALKDISQKAKDMTPDEFRNSLVASGIITDKGQLSTHYSRSPKKKSSTK